MTTRILPHDCPAHAYLALHLLARKAAGRKRLGDEMGLGSGHMRKLLTRLVDKGLARPFSTGHEVSEEGHAVTRAAIDGPVLVNARGITAPGRHALVVVRGARYRLEDTVALHDAAVRAGGSGASVFITEPGRGHVMPEGIPFNRRTLRAILKGRKPGHDDVVVVGAGTTRATARLAATAAAMELLGITDLDRLHEGTRA